MGTALIRAGSAFPARVTLGESPLQPESGVPCLTPGVPSDTWVVSPTPHPRNCQARPPLAGALEAHPRYQGLKPRECPPAVEPGRAVLWARDGPGDRPLTLRWPDRL